MYEIIMNTYISTDCMKILIPQGEGISAQSTATASDDTTTTANSPQSPSDSTSNVLSLTTTTNGMYSLCMCTYIATVHTVRLDLNFMNTCVCNSARTTRV